MRINTFNLIVCFITTYIIVQYTGELFPNLDWFHLTFMSAVLTFLFPLPLASKKEESSK